MFDAKMTSVF